MGAKVFVDHRLGRHSLDGNLGVASLPHPIAAADLAQSKVRNLHDGRTHDAVKQTVTSGQVAVDHLLRVEVFHASGGLHSKLRQPLLSRHRTLVAMPIKKGLQTAHIHLKQFELVLKRENAYPIEDHHKRRPLDHDAEELDNIGMFEVPHGGCLLQRVRNLQEIRF